MKRALLIGLGLLISLFLVAPASAFVFVYVDVQKDKSVTVNESIYISKDVDINVDLDVSLEGAAEAIALANQENWGGEVDGAGDGEGPAAGNFRDATIRRSINENRGIVGVNQDAGNMNNQGNNVAVAVTDALDSFANAESSASQINVANEVEALEDVDNLIDPTTGEILPPQKSGTIAGSITMNRGIVGVNQSVGNMNNQLNNVALAAGLEGVDVALSEADLGQLNAFNLVFETNTHKADTISASINANTGIVGVNQSAGNMNNQGNVVSAAVTR